MHSHCFKGKDPSHAPLSRRPAPTPQSHHHLCLPHGPFLVRCLLLPKVLPSQRHLRETKASFFLKEKRERKIAFPRKRTRFSGSINWRLMGKRGPVSVPVLFFLRSSPVAGRTALGRVVARRRGESSCNIPESPWAARPARTPESVGIA